MNEFLPRSELEFKHEKTYSKLLGTYGKNTKKTLAQEKCY